jgi:hypothetical protein
MDRKNKVIRLIGEGNSFGNMVSYFQLKENRPVNLNDKTIEVAKK